jgi:D-glycero-D-manno-heptose 1,7-bisphosphate phosphatase
MRTAIFLDRDGTINEEVHYLSHPDQLRLISGAAEAIKQLRAAGYLIVVITNQSGLTRKYFTQETLDEIHARLRSELARHDAWLDGIYYCPHHPDDGCDCRKPGSRLFQQAADDHDIDLTPSVMIGDKDTDVLAARNLNMRGILVRTGFGASQLDAVMGWNDFQPSYIADDLLDAANWLLAAHQ